MDILIIYIDILHHKKLIQKASASSEGSAFVAIDAAVSRKTSFPSCRQRHHHRHAQHDIRRRQGTKSGLRP